MLLPDECFLKARLMNFRDDDGYLHNLRYWTAQRLHRATILLVHGIQSHSGWYGYSCQKLAEAGFEVIFPDRRGSGLNLQDRGHAESIRQLINDLFKHLQYIREKYPLEQSTLPPLFLGGISWGGRLAVASALDWNRYATKAGSSYSELAGLTMLYPGIHSHFSPTGFQRFLLKIFARDILGTFQRDIPTNTPELFTRTPAFLDWMANDKWTLRRATVSFFRISQELVERTGRDVLPLNLPLLLMLAGDDEIIDNTKTSRWFDSLPSADKHSTTYPGTRHTLEFEPTRDQFIQDLIDWLTVRATPTKALT